MLLALVVVCGWLAVHFYRRELREALEMRQQLTQSQLLIERQKKLAQKGQTGAELAHEISNPLAAINFRLYTLQKELAGSPDEHRDTALIRKEIRRLNAILEDFLQLDQSTQPKFEMISAEAALREARELMAPQLAAQRIQVKLESDGNTDMSADPQLLQQVLINLIKNAAESIDGDGIITLRARRDTAELRRHQTDVVIIEVQDTGQGIPPEVQEQLFDPFFTTKKGGSGLGLSIVERIVEKHRGLLDFDTEIGKGSTFRVVLPVELDR
jgi:signal transduction histidine kinase